jgi:hypothetical protein
MTRLMAKESPEAGSAARSTGRPVASPRFVEVAGFKWSVPASRRRRLRNGRSGGLCSHRDERSNHGGNHTCPMRKYEIPVYKAEREAGLAEVDPGARVDRLRHVPLEVGYRGERPLLRTTISAFAARTWRPGAGEGADEVRVRPLLPQGRARHDRGDEQERRHLSSRTETWAARHTPEDKPFNFEHRPLDIIGHITASRVVDETMKELDDGTLAVDDLPTKFHIVSGSVLYMALSDDDRKALMQQTVAEIEKGEWYVSMECFFRGFDYGVDRAGRGPPDRPPERGDGVPHQVPAAVRGGRRRRTRIRLRTGSTRSRASLPVGPRAAEHHLQRARVSCVSPGNPESIILNSVAAFTPTLRRFGVCKGRDRMSVPIQFHTECREEIIQCPRPTPTIRPPRRPAS